SPSSEAVVTQYKDLIKEQDSRYRELKTRSSTPCKPAAKQLTREKASFGRDCTQLRDQNTVLKAAASGRSGLAPAVASVAASASTASSSMPSAWTKLANRRQTLHHRWCAAAGRDQLAARETELSHLRARAGHCERKSSPSPAAAGSSGGSVVEAATAYFPERLRSGEAGERQNTGSASRSWKEQVAERWPSCRLYATAFQRRIDELLVIEAGAGAPKASWQQQQQPEDTPGAQGS
uniref:Centrosomal protein of 162 kDa n=1 Tax=Macrostomum lignano TaxID=282301 RepID=A0A1I8FJZ2_9PLAT